MARRGARQITTVQRVPAPEPQASIAPGASRLAQVAQFGLDQGVPDIPADQDALGALAFLQSLAQAPGDISDLIGPGIAERIGQDAVKEWDIDCGSITDWTRITEEGLAKAAQESDRQGDGTGKDYPFENASNIHYPIITTATQQFAARAMPELVKGDKAIGIKVLEPGPSGLPQAPQMSQQQDQAHAMKEARAKRLEHYLNWQIFYKMDNWEGETDALLHEMPVSGVGFKKVYMGPEGLASDYVSALRLTVHSDTKSLHRCPRVTQDFDVYPYEIDQRRRSGQYRDVDLPVEGQDPETPRLFIEQYRMEDLDGDGLAEPYIVTVDTVTRNLMRLEAGYAVDDIIVNEETGRVVRIDRWLPFSTYLFLPDPRGRFYGLGFARLLDSITESLDTAINQLMDAGNAEIAGGGFIAANVRLQGSGQGGALYTQPGEYAVVSTPGPDLQQSIWERTVPHPSTVIFSLMEFLLAAAKDIASIKDVITGDAPSTAPVGTTLALQNQALQVFSAIYKRVYRGFREEFRLMFGALKRWATPQMKAEYKQLTGGDFDQDFAGDGTEIQPISDPSVVTRMQKISRVQTLIQLAESPVGMAAGMTQPGAAQALITEAMDALDVDRPQRFLAQVPPNPLQVAKTQEMNANAQLKTADAHMRLIEGGKAQAETNLTAAKTVHTMGEAAQDTHRLRLETHDIASHGIKPPSPKDSLSAQAPPIDHNALFQAAQAARPDNPPAGAA